MLSAFGIDHGEVSKAFLRPQTVTRAQKATRGLPGTRTRSKALKAGLNRVGDTPITIKGIGRTAGGAVRGVGSVFEGHPGLTGTALVGGGGAAGYTHLKNKEPRKKK